MIPKTITSLQHPIVKHLVKVRQRREYRTQHQSALIVGCKLVEEISAASPLKILLVEKSHPIPKQVHAPQIFLVPTSILKKITALENPEPLAAEVPLPALSDLSKKEYLIALDGVSDPGNLGTLLRTALALGWEGAFITTGSADPFNEKALRAAKGATFRLPLSLGTPHDLLKLVEKSRFQTFVADIRGEPLHRVQMRLPVLLILGNESQGVSNFLKNQFPSISIPLQGPMESLNVAIAGGILMYTIKHQT